MRIQINTHKDEKRRNLFATLKFVAAFATLASSPITAPTQTHAEEGRIHITFLKAGYGGGSGYLFYQGQKYGLGISSAHMRRVWVTTIDLVGTVSNLRSPADIIGTYRAADPGPAIVRRSKIARLENAKGVLLEIRAVNLNPWFTLDLSGLTIRTWAGNPRRISIVHFV